jgi:hypothetical protein
LTPHRTETGEIRLEPVLLNAGLAIVALVTVLVIILALPPG